MEWLISLTSPSFSTTNDSGSEDSGGKKTDNAIQNDQREDKDNIVVDQKRQVESLKSVSSPSKARVETGFGAPLWVLLVAVIGSALFTISIVLMGIKEAPLQLSPGEIRMRIQSVVLHQFYIIFAPLGAIFVYQLLVIAGAASQAFSVAIVALAAGIALNMMLERAKTSVEGLISKSHS